LSKSDAAIRRNHWLHPVDLIKEAKRLGCIGLAYTYNEPIIFSEWVQTVAEEAQRQGLKNVLVTNGYVTPVAREAVFQHIDAVNVDLKGIRELFYRKKTLAHLDPVLDTLRWLVSQKRVWLEITNLVIPGVNDSSDDLDKLTRFIASELKRWIPLHFTAFHPDYKMLQVPATPLRILQQARRIAIRNGLQFVYLGNVTHPQGQTTLCPHCRQVLIQRNYYSTRICGMNSNQCGNCGKTIPGRFQWNGACS